MDSEIAIKLKNVNSNKHVTGYLACISLAIIYVPHLTFVLLNQTSPSTGIFAVLLIFIPLLFLYLGNYLKINRLLIVPLSFFLGILIIQSCIAYILNQSLSIKAILSFLLLFLSLLYIIIYYNAFKHLPFAYLLSIMRKFIYLNILLGWLSIIFYDIIPVYNLLLHGVFPFYEPSHYALAIAFFAPSVFMMESRKIKFFIIINLSALAIALPNLTLMAVVVLCFLLDENKKKLDKFILFGISSTAILFISLINDNFSYFDYVKFRLSNFSESSTNISTLVYIQGWQEIWHSLISTNGLGLGFQRMGENAPLAISEKIYKLAGGYLNLHDGGFIFSKFISELGFVGMVFFIYFIKQLIKLKFYISKFKLHSIPINNSDGIHKLKLSFVLSCSFFIELLFRGYGYFSFNSIFFIAIQLYIFTELKNRKT
ncbi:hypothetical protein [Xenorhabdus siamensis]|uniref:hypothetical protein n=1 Tax=Xenorhabdus siamensis TaxID=3136254 RepID=UPI0030F3B237